MRVAVYCRVSTEDQKTLPMQEEAIRAYAAIRDMEVVACVSEAVSGASVRPRREELLKMARRRRIDAILVYRLDRWGRSLPDLVTSLNELTSLGVAFISVNEGFDLTTPMGRAMAGMLSVMAEFERDILRERVKAGMAAARKRGKHLGRANTTAIHEERIRELHKQGVSLGKIAEEVNIAKSSVARIIKVAKEQEEITVGADCVTL